MLLMSAEVTFYFQQYGKNKRYLMMIERNIWNREAVSSQIRLLASSAFLERTSEHVLERLLFLFLSR